MVKACSFYINIKNNDTYWVECNNIIDCTNNRNGSIMVLYYKLDNNNDLESINWNQGFVREVNEFEIKFKQMEIIQ